MPKQVTCLRGPIAPSRGCPECVYRALRSETFVVQELQSKGIILTETLAI